MEYLRISVLLMVAVNEWEIHLEKRGDRLLFLHRILTQGPLKKEFIVLVRMRFGCCVSFYFFYAHISICSKVIIF